jgi:hypothetical protein
MEQMLPFFHNQDLLITNIILKAGAYALFF